MKRHHEHDREGSKDIRETKAGLEIIRANYPIETIPDKRLSFRTPRELAAISKYLQSYAYMLKTTMVNGLTQQPFIKQQTTVTVIRLKENDLL